MELEENNVITANTVEPSEGKLDQGKLQMHLAPTQIYRDVAEVRMFGVKKYTENNWATVSIDRYKDALIRHILAFMDDEDSVDEESGIPHYKHAICNLAFIAEMKRADWNDRKNKILGKDTTELEKSIDNNKKALDQLMKSIGQTSEESNSDSQESSISGISDKEV